MSYRWRDVALVCVGRKGVFTSRILLAFSFGEGGRGVEQKERERGGYSAVVIAITLPLKKKNASVCLWSSHELEEVRERARERERAYES